MEFPIQNEKEPTVALISPGIEVSVSDESQYVPFAAATVPLIIFATEAERHTLTGSVITPMPGTYESNVLRSLTSFTQAFNLYGTPRFLEDNAGQQMHGDCRNEVGLLTAYKWLQSNGRCYGLRAEVDLNDDINRLLLLWASKIESAAQLLEATVQQRIDDFNTSNGYYVGHPNYKTTVSVNELMVDLDTVLDVAIYPTFAFRNIAGSFQQAQNPTLPVYANGYNQPPVAPNYPGLATLVSQQVNQLADVRVATTQPLTVTANAATLTNAGVQQAISIDGVSLVVGDRVLVKDQLNPAENGVYDVTTVGDDTTTNWVLARSADFNENSEVLRGSYTLVTLGDINRNKLFALTTTDDPILVGATDLVFEQTTGITYTPDEAAQLLIDAGAEYQYTVEFRNLTSLGDTDAERRQTIVESFQAMIATNTDIRAETLDYNLIVCPGFPELDDDLINFVSSQDIGEEVFIVSAPPYNVSPTEAAQWGTSLTSARKFSKMISYNYPHGITTNTDGVDVFVPATLGVINVYGYNDVTSQLWYAPAGTQRGAVRDFNRIGYLTGTLGTVTEFVDAPLSRGDRDELYKFGTNINPITNLPGRGIHLMGQKTSAPDASALDRINVVRLVCYVRRQLRRNLVPFLFQPNDKITRDNVNSMVSGFLEGIKIRRGLYDFAVDTESGATPENIDNNILEVRVALAPTKAIEFIYVKLQIVRTGAI